MKTVSGKEFCRIIERKGWLPVRTTGSHHVYTDGAGRSVSVPVHANEDLKKGLQRRLMKDAGVTEDEL